MARYPVRFSGERASLLFRDCFELPRLPSAEEQERVVSKAKSDTLAAKTCLQMFALRIRHDMDVADTLAAHIADALEAAAEVPASASGKVLTEALGLTAPRRRRSGDALSIGEFIEGRIAAGELQTSAIEAAALEFEIDPRTARRYLKQYRAAFDESGRD